MSRSRCTCRCGHACVSSVVLPKFSSEISSNCECYAMTALCHLTVTWIGLGRVGSEWTLASAHALRLPPIIVQVFHTYYGTRVLGFSGRVVQDKYEETR